jgi:bifunctional DNase/RNase
MAGLIAVKVRGLILDERSKSPIVILQEEDGKRVLPIWIGEAEARAINMILTREKMERPMTHDLLHTAIQGLGGTVVGITITGIQEHTFFAEIHVQCGGEQILLDARPSDSIALALWAGAPIQVSEEVMESSAQTGPSPQMTREQKAERLRRMLDDLDPGEFGSGGL